MERGENLRIILCVLLIVAISLYIIFAVLNGAFSLRTVTIENTTTGECIFSFQGRCAVKISRLGTDINVWYFEGHRIKHARFFGNDMKTLVLEN